jgi:hypothetical protein
VTEARQPEPPSRAKLIRATLIAAVVAGVLLITIVLPAEYGIDPLGTGEALGLVVLSGTVPLTDIPVRPDGIIAQPHGYRVDRRTFRLGPGEYVEYKYRMEQGGTMVYTWSASGPVRSEMHSEPWWRGSTAEFFEVEEATRERHGSYTAPFPGIHGWYWLNENDAPVTVTIAAAGFFQESIEFADESSTPIVREIAPPSWGEESNQASP